MKNDKIRVGLTGAGPDHGWAKGVQAQALKALPLIVIPRESRNYTVIS
jgi:hypothetical protein